MMQSNQNNEKWPIALLTVSLVLMASGSLRDLVTPVGYWGAWGLWAVMVFILKQRDIRSNFLPPLWIVGAYGLLWLGMSIAAFVNKDLTTAYQSAKVAVIAVMFVAMWHLVRYVDGHRLVEVTGWAVVVILFSLVFSRFLFPLSGNSFLIGHRESSLLASYGVLWKVGAFFLPIFLADLVVSPRLWLRNGFMIAACLFLVLIDGSRTGLLVLLAVGLGFLAVLVQRGGWPLVVRMARWLWVIPVVLFVMQVIDIWAHAGSSHPMKIIEAAWLRTVDTRLWNGDTARLRLIVDALHQILPCQPFGCGFKATGTDIFGKGELMPVHNAYLAAFGDFGILGLTGMLGFLMAAVLPIWRVLRQGDRSAQSLFVVAASGSALAYGMALMFNTFTTEMSEWGYLILMLAFAWAPAKNPG